MSLATNAYNIFSEALSANGLPLCGEQEEAFKPFLEVLELGLYGTLPPQFYLLSADPGMGKTTACIAFIKAWREAGFEPATSILVGISTLSDLLEFIEKTGLADNEFGVLTSDADMNALGLPQSRHQEAKVLFTTQAMIRSRTRGKRFAEAEAFFYDGRTRPLRIWDEEILPRHWKTLRLDHVRSLASPLRPRLPDLVDQLDAFATMVNEADADSIVKVPSALRRPSYLLTNALRYLEAQHLRLTLEALNEMAGKEMLVRSGDRYGKELVGVTDGLPDDIAPLVIVDASGRVREAYDVWEKHRGDLVRLTPAGSSFHQLNVHHWNRGSGKEALEDDETLAEIAEAIVEAFDRDPKGEWLVITHQDSVDSLKEAIKALTPPVDEDHLHWTYWGRHRSTNEFKDISNIAVIGLLNYRQTDYVGLSLAAAGLPVTATDYPDPSQLRLGELQHHLLQGICRGSVRKTRGGIADKCNAFVIARLGDGETFFEDIFPGHSYVQWKDVQPDPGQRIEQAIAFVREGLQTAAGAAISKGAIREALGARKQEMTRVYNSPRFRYFLAEIGYEAGHTDLYPIQSAFEPIED